jgi:uncharacterized protein
MQLSFEPPGTRYYVRRCEAGRITVVDQVFESSFLLATDRIATWDATSVEALSLAQLAPILALEPEVVLLGSGARLRFPPPLVVAAFLKRGIGVETMDNAAAARTFNVLAGEGRKVVAAFLLPDA